MTRSRDVHSAAIRAAYDAVDLQRVRIHLDMSLHGGITPRECMALGNLIADEVGGTINVECDDDGILQWVSVLIGRDGVATIFVGDE